MFSYILRHVVRLSKAAPCSSLCVTSYRVFPMSQGGHSPSLQYSVGEDGEHFSLVDSSDDEVLDLVESGVNGTVRRICQKHEIAG